MAESLSGMGERREKEKRKRKRWIDHTESKLDCGTFEWDERKKGEG